MTASAENLYTHLGSTTPRWLLRQDSDALNFIDANGEVLVSKVLTAEQAAQVRALTGTTRALELELQLSAGADHCDLILVGKRSDVGVWTGFAADFSSARVVAQALQQGLAFAEQVVSEVHSLVVIIDQNGKLKRLNKLCEELSGFREEDLIGRNAHDLFMPEAEHDDARRNIAHFFATGESWSVERPIRTRNGVRQVLWRNKFVKGGPEEGTYLVCSGVDITEEREAKQKLLELATTDVLTGLANRHAIQEHIAARLAVPDNRFAVLYLDLDNFKQVNDHYGHAKGDKLIVAVAGLIKQSLRGNDMLARLGGDELVVVLDGADAATAQAVAGRILDRMKAAPVVLENVELYTNCSVGIALAHEHGASVDELIRNADTAMYCAKDDGKGQFRVFTQSMTEKAREYIWLDRELRKSFGAGQLELHYQPKVCLRTGRALGVEALIRWRHPERGFVSPLNFIPYAEESGIIHDLGAWVLREAVLQSKAWADEGLELRVAVNISARQLGSDRVLRHFKDYLLETGQARSLVDIELTESCLAHDEELALSLINQFKDLGCEVHLDDFGTGYSSLSQLVRMPIDVLKMDRSFIRKLCEDKRSQALVRSVVAVSQELGCKLVAEGVETEEQAAMLRDLGAGQAQGYLFAKPMPAKDATVWLQTQQSKPTLRRVA
jgi:c-di-GMP phosphodiesterase Gmr